MAVPTLVAVLAMTLIRLLFQDLEGENHIGSLELEGGIQIVFAKLEGGIYIVFAKVKVETRSSYKVPPPVMTYQIETSVCTPIL